MASSGSTTGRADQRPRVDAVQSATATLTASVAYTASRVSSMFASSEMWSARSLGSAESRWPSTLRDGPRARHHETRIASAMKRPTGARLRRHRFRPRTSAGSPHTNRCRSALAAKCEVMPLREPPTASSLVGSTMFSKVAVAAAGDIRQADVGEVIDERRRALRRRRRLIRSAAEPTRFSIDTPARLRTRISKPAPIARVSVSASFNEELECEQQTEPPHEPARPGRLAGTER